MNTIELGGGNRPIYRPNVDVRKLDNVDIVLNFNNPPYNELQSNEYDLVYSSYLIEHISWRLIKQFINEVFRILRPLGKVQIITANLLEQCKIVADSKEWDENFSTMIFGDLDYSENSHKVGFSPDYAKKLFESIGFIQVEVKDHPNCKTDMIIEAIKPEVGSNNNVKDDIVIKDAEFKEVEENMSESIKDIDSKQLYDRSYYDGDGIGYKGEGYRNFPSNYTIASTILDILDDMEADKLPVKKGAKWVFEQPKVLELGGARGYISHILESQEIDATCMDISEHCFYTRACKNFVLGDITDKLPFQDKEFDLCFSKDLLEHISVDKVSNLVKEIVRVSKRSLHLVTFEDHPHAKDDKTHKCLKSNEWWNDIFGYFAEHDYIYEIVNKEKYETADLNTIKKFFADPSINRVNIGSYTQMYHNWQNWDIIDLSRWAAANGFNFKRVDIAHKLPEDDGKVSLINCSHVIEHLSREEGLSFLKECHRILKNDGIIRLAIPDAAKICEAYINCDIGKYQHFNIGVEKAVKNNCDLAGSLWEMLVSGHKTAYDYNSLHNVLSDAGFKHKNISQKDFLESDSPIIKKEVVDMYSEVSTYIEARKTGKKVDERREEKEEKEEKRKLIYTVNGVPVDTGGTMGYGPNISYGDIGANKLEVKEKLKIALISTPFFTVPPKSYGGLEMVVYDLAVGLDKLGHEVTIFGPKGSKAPKHGHVVVICPSNDTVNTDWLKLEKENYDIYRDVITPNKFDIVHDHTWFSYIYLSKMKDPKLRILHTQHGGYVWETYPPVGKANLVAISQFMSKYTDMYFGQRGSNIKCQFVHNGIDLDKYPFVPGNKKSDRLLFVGRLSTFKKPDWAIEIARKTGQKLDIIGGSKFIDSHEYVKQLEKSIEGDHNIKLYKDVTHEFKIKKMQGAKAILIPSKMNEPLNLVSIEGQACGTPVIVTRDGGLPETVVDNDNGRTGFVCDSLEQMIDAVGKIHMIDPSNCRKNAEKNFSREIMAKAYQDLYYRILRGEEW